MLVVAQREKTWFQSLQATLPRKRLRTALVRVTGIAFDTCMWLCVRKRVVCLRAGLQQSGHWEQESGLTASSIIRSLFAVSMDGGEKEECIAAARSVVQQIVRLSALMSRIASAGPVLLAI